MATFEFKEGKRVKPNGAAIVGAFYCREPAQIMAYSEDGQAHLIHTEKFRSRNVNR